MSTVGEIAEALSSLNNDELHQVERTLISIYRQRKTGILYDDAYGVWTEEEQAAAAGEVFALMDAAEKQPGKSPQP